jgi:hypothetical protein
MGTIWGCLAISAAVAALVTGLGAAWWWYQSAQVQPDPGWGLPGEGRAIEPSDQDMKNMAWTAAMLRASTAAAEMNRKAAILTAWSVVLSAVSALMGAIGG